MAIQDWWCPVCGWWWAISKADNRIKAIGCHRDTDHLVSLDIGGWAAAPSRAEPRS